MPADCAHQHHIGDRWYCLRHSENLSLAFLHISWKFMCGKAGLDGRKRRARVFGYRFSSSCSSHGTTGPTRFECRLAPHTPDDNIKWFVSPKHCKAMTKLFLSIFIYLSELIFHVVVLLFAADAAAVIHTNDLILGGTGLDWKLCCTQHERTDTTRFACCVYRRENHIS